MRLGIRIRGVRGSVPTPQDSHLQFGGNTPCVEILAPSGESLIFDAGTGIRELAPARAHIFLSHFHWDHIQGLPFFAPLFRQDCRVSFYCGATNLPLRDAIEGQMTKPYFPLEFAKIGAECDFHEIADGNTVETGGVTVIPFPLNHPQGATGYRIESGGAVIVYATDHEHGDFKLDEGLQAYAQNADILICDAQYTPQQYERRQGWGHSTWVKATEVAKAAGVKKLLLFHHDPLHCDRTMLSIEAAAKERFENTEAAREGFGATL